MRNFLSGCILLLSSLPAIAGPTAPGVSQSEIPSELLPAPLLQISETEAFSKFVFLVDKEQRKLTVFERDGEKIKKVEEYPADIGKNGGNKTKRDDARTPEGIYFLEKRLSQPDIPFNLYGALAFTTNYPNLFDRRQNKTGSGIWLHAIPDTVALTR
ncbi:MAG: L,D-transpeptidase family protein, partial [Bacillota bacterium]